MRSFKRELIGLAALSAMVLASGTAIAQTQAQPQPQQQPDQMQSQPQQPNQAQPQPNQGQSQTASTFTGTVVKNGDQFVLRDSSGAVYGLDDSSKAKAFEGKTVKVTGQLDEQAKVIHVTDIQAAEA